MAINSFSDKLIFHAFSCFFHTHIYFIYFYLLYFLFYICGLCRMFHFNLKCTASKIKKYWKTSIWELALFVRLAGVCGFIILYIKNDLMNAASMIRFFFFFCDLYIRIIWINCRRGSGKKKYDKIIVYSIGKYKFLWLIETFNPFFFVGKNLNLFDKNHNNK